MTAELLDGKLVSALVKDALKSRVQNLKKLGITPALRTILVGDDIGSRKYVAGKHQDCLEVGIESLAAELPADAAEEEVLDVVHAFNVDPKCTAYIVQLPLPKHINQEKVLSHIDPKKDADGLHPLNLGALVTKVSGEISSPLPCTPLGIVRILDHYGISLSGKSVAIIGRGTTVGRPLSLLLTRKGIDATVIQLHSKSADISYWTQKADVVVSAIGNAHFLAACDIKKHAVVIDVGVSRVFDEEVGRHRVLGDCAKDVRDIADFVTPNPGGVGPMTRAMLLENVVKIAEAQVA